MTIKKILLPTDFSPLAGRAAEAARLMARQFDATLCVIHVRDLAITPLLTNSAEMAEVSALTDEHELRNELKAFVGAHLDSISTRIITEIINGSPATAIPQFAAQHNIDLIVIGAHPHNALSRMFFGSTGEAVIEHAPCPVLSVPATVALPASASARANEPSQTALQSAAQVARA